MQLHQIVLYCLFGVLLLLFAFLLFKIFNISTKLKLISTFLDGEVFSERFHNVIDNYFSHSETIDRLMDHVLPLVYAHTSVVYGTPVTALPDDTQLDGVEATLDEEPQLDGLEATPAEELQLDVLEATLGDEPQLDILETTRAEEPQLDILEATPEVSKSESTPSDS